ncbi:MAG: SDR family NAD(P)-dependent oxidoreductase [Mycobacterium sp.]|uniref:SDR family NAD(P)-dependent oxidoreductase n=1 Tax=Mycobacterium sp. TaxID=1785 RepID=UPI003CC60CCF
MSSFTDKVAVITGAGSGIGRALSIALGRRGARLAISDINEDGLTDTADQLQSLGAATHVQLLDVSNRNAVRAYATMVVEHYGVVHQLYNNAGIAGASATVQETDYSAYERIIAVNLWGVINGSKEFLPHLIASGDGHVINVSSLNGLMGQASMTGYCSTKFAVRGFSESLRAEMLFNNHPVRVSVVHPGGVKTNIATAALEEAGETGDEHIRRARVYNEKLLRLPAAKAADIIVAGVAANRPRIIVGNDARLVDLMVRALPRSYPRLSAWWSRRVFNG